MPSLYANIVSSNAVIQPNNNTSLYNPLGGNTIPVNGNVNANNVNVSNNVTVGGQISAVGNIITDGFFIGNGSQLTGVASSYGNANVATFLPTYSGNLAGQNLALTGAAIITGNVTSGGYYFGDGSQLTNLPATSYGNANVAAFLPTYSGNISAGNVTVASGITGATLAVSSTISATGDIETSGNLRTLGAQGNIVGANYVSAGYFVGDGSLLTNVVATTSYSNANVVTLLASFGSNTVSTTGNISSGFFLGNGSQLTGITAASSYGNANVADFLANGFGSNTVSTTGNIEAGNVLLGYLLGAGDVTATGNVTGAQIIGNASQLTSITGANVTGVVANATFATSAGSATTATTADQANYANIANSVSGSNVSGSVAQANYANTANAVAGGNVSGQVANALIAGTVYTNAQPNITSVGTLTSLSVSGNINSGGNIVATTVQATGSGGLALKNSGGTTQASLGAGGGDNFAVNVSTNLNGNNAQIDISPTGTGHVHINPTGTGAVEIAPTSIGSVNNMVIGNATPRAANVTTLGTTGNITAAGILTDGYYYANGAPFSGGGTYGNANVNTLLAAWGSNTISTTGSITAGNVTGGNVLTGGTVSATGNVTGNYILGNGSQLTGVSATPAGTNLNFQYNNSNVFGGVPNTAFYTGNGVIEIASTKFEAGAGPSSQITVPGALGYVSVTGNVIAGNVNAGVITATGNIAGNYFIGNGSQLANIAAGGSANTLQFNNSGVFGGITDAFHYTANGITEISKVKFSSTASGGGSGELFVPGTAGYVSVVGNVIAGNVNTAGVITATGNVTAGNVLTGGTVSATGNVTGNYFIGNGSALTGISVTPGGSNTQIQYNNANTLAGNVLMTFNTTTGNIGLGNLVINTNTIQTNVGIDIANYTAFGTTTPWRIIMGNAYLGSANSIYAPTAPGVLNNNQSAPRLLVGDFVTLDDTGRIFREVNTTVWANLSANISNNNTRLSASTNIVMLGGGASNFGYAGTGTPAVSAGINQVVLGRGTNANLSAVGNIAMTNGAIGGHFNAIVVNQSSNTQYAVATVSNLSAADNSGIYGNIGNGVCYYASMSGVLSNTSVVPTTAYASFYQPSSSSANNIFGSSSLAMGTIPRNATRYHAFRNDDNLAMSRLGSLETMHYATANVTSSGGAITIDKLNGQSQMIFPTENVTSVTFSNFVIRVAKPSGTNMNQTDFVTFFVQQGATPYDITFPSGNTQIRYANGVSTITGVANTTVQVNITGIYNYNVGAANYLVTVNSAFS